MSRTARRSARRIPLSTQTFRLLGIFGLFGGTLMLAVTVAILVRLVVVGDVLNPFGDFGGGLFGLPNATPNPDFLAPTIDVGNVQAWQGTEPVIILLMGGDSRPGEEDYRPRTDTMMLVRVDPVAHTAGILSIPRDLYVDIPGYGLERVNTAYPFGGRDLTVQTIEYNFGVRVNHTILIEFDAFVTFVDQIGGIDIYVPAAIDDPSYPDDNYGYDPFYLPAGQQHLDGETALKYARTRHGDNDFERARRQQAVLFAIRDRILSLDMLPTLIQNAPALYATVSDSVITDLTLEQMISLALLIEDIPEENIRTGVIDANYVLSYVTPEGAAVLIPDRYRIGPYIEHVFWLDE